MNVLSMCIAIILSAIYAVQLIIVIENLIDGRTASKKEFRLGLVPFLPILLASIKQYRKL